MVGSLNEQIFRGKKSCLLIHRHTRHCRLRGVGGKKYPADNAISGMISYTQHPRLQNGNSLVRNVDQGKLNFINTLSAIHAFSAILDKSTLYHDCRRSIPRYYEVCFPISLSLIPLSLRLCKHHANYSIFRDGSYR